MVVIVQQRHHIDTSLDHNPLTVSLGGSARKRAPPEDHTSVLDPIRNALVPREVAYHVTLLNIQLVIATYVMTGFLRTLHTCTLPTFPTIDVTS